MGLNAVGGMELAPNVLSGTITGTASSTASNTSFIQMLGTFNVVISGVWGGATMQLQKSFDGGATFVPATTDASGTSASYTSNVAVVVYEPEPGVLYRWQPTIALTSGTVAWRISGGPRVT